MFLTHISISLDCGSNLFRPRCNCELGLALQSFIQSLLGQRGCSAHVFIARVGAATDQTCLYVWKTSNWKKLKVVLHVFLIWLYIYHITRVFWGLKIRLTSLDYHASNMLILQMTGMMLPSRWLCKLASRLSCNAIWSHLLNKTASTNKAWAI